MSIRVQSKQYTIKKVWDTVRNLPANKLCIYMDVYLYDITF